MLKGPGNNGHFTTFPFPEMYKELFRRIFNQDVLRVSDINIILSFVTEVHCVQRFEQQPSYTEVNPGQDALLVCKVFNKRGSCSWQKDNKVSGKRILRGPRPAACEVWCDLHENIYPLQSFCMVLLYQLSRKKLLLHVIKHT